MMITLTVDNGRQGKDDQLGLECVVGVTLTRRWYQDGKVMADKRPGAVRPQPSNKLTETKQAKIVNGNVKLTH